jgi:hypothetical protein
VQAGAGGGHRGGEATEAAEVALCRLGLGEAAEAAEVTEVTEAVACWLGLGEATEAERSQRLQRLRRAGS